MRKRIIVAIVATLVLGGTTVAVAGSQERRAPSKPTAEDLRPMSKSLAKVNDRLLQAKRVKCRTIGCVNRTLTRLSKAVKNLNRDAFKCEQYVNVTRYDGYVYSPDGGATVFPTTALDYTTPGDTVSNRVVVYTC